MQVATRKLYDEFRCYYDDERCEWAPRSAKRVFRLAFTTVYPGYQNRMSKSEFLGMVYEALGFRNSSVRGLFQKFDPARYHGVLPLEDHFVNQFKRALIWKLNDWRRRFVHRRRGKPKHRSYLMRYESCARCEFDGLVRQLKSLLSKAEWMVVNRVYWKNKSFRQIGLEMGIDHKTARRRHAEALARLRRALGVEEFSDSVRIFSPNGSARNDEHYVVSV